VPTLRVRWPRKGEADQREEATADLLEIPFSPGDSVRELLSPTAFRVSAACLGNGACGLCRVQIEEGDGGEPAEVEQLYIEPDKIALGERLACRVHPQADMTVSVLAPAPRTEWRSIPDDDDLDDRLGTACNGPEIERSGDIRSTDFVDLGDHEPLGLAIDIGTTFVSVALYSFVTGERVASRHGANPQRSFGADVLTRLLGASKSQEVYQELRQQLIGGIGTALKNISIQDGIARRRIVRAEIVANTAILSLFAGRNTEMLIDPRHWSETIDCSLGEEDDPLKDWGLNAKAKVRLVQPVAGFIGSDLLVGLLAGHIMQRPPGSLFIDFGTNTEMALWDGETIWTTSAAGGPAFEGCGITCGAPAGPGAIHRVGINGSGLVCDILPGAEPTGVCGSGLVDLVACLLEIGELNARGSLAGDAARAGYDVLGDGGNIRLRKRDVDVVQRAKAAVAVGAAILSNLAPEGVDISEVLVAGTFGRHLDVRHAQAIGLLPELPLEHVHLCGNTALEGAAQLLLSKNAESELLAMRQAIKMVNLAERDDFEDLYISNLLIQPSVTDAIGF